MAASTTFIDHTGERRRLGIRPTPPHLAGYFAPSTETLVAQKDWIEFNDWPGQIKRKNQGQYTACVEHGFATAAELARNIQGQAYYELDPWASFALLCGGQDDGTSLADCFRLGMTWGNALAGSIRPGTLDARTVTPAITAQAARFKIAGGVALTKQTEIMSAVQRRQPIVVSICVGDGFDQLDQDGVATLGSGYDNHGVCAFGGARFIARLNDWIVKVANSWGTSWGLDGFFWARLSRLAINPYFAGFRATAMIQDPRSGLILPNFS